MRCRRADSRSSAAGRSCRAGPTVGPVVGRDAARVWLLAVPHDDDDRVAFVARPLSLRFTADEVARVEALVRLRDRVSVRD